MCKLYFRFFNLNYVALGRRRDKEFLVRLRTSPIYTSSKLVTAHLRARLSTCYRVQSIYNVRMSARTLLVARSSRRCQAPELTDATKRQAFFCLLRLEEYSSTD